jgi:hypothetical protein
MGYNLLQNGILHNIKTFQEISNNMAKVLTKVVINQLAFLTSLLIRTTSFGLMQFANALSSAIFRTILLHTFGFDEVDTFVATINCIPFFSIYELTWDLHHPHH